MPRVRPDCDRIKIKFKSEIDESITLMDMGDLGKCKMNNRQKKAYVERLMEDFDRKMAVREEQMREDLEVTIQKFEKMLDSQLQQLPKVLWEMPYEEFLRRGNCMHEVMMSLERDKEREEKENYAREAAATAKSKQTLTAKRKMAASTKKKKRQVKINPQVVETPIVSAEAGDCLATPLTTPHLYPRLPETTPRTKRQPRAAAQRKLLSVSHQSGRYNTRSSVRAAQAKQVFSPGLSAAKELVLASMIQLVEQAPDRATLKAIQESVKAIP